jgi:hypothetical protein
MLFEGRPILTCHLLCYSLTSRRLHFDVEDCYVAIRSLQKPERTPEVQAENLKAVSDAFAEEGLVANIRLETYSRAEYFHLPPPPPSNL